MGKSPAVKQRSRSCSVSLKRLRKNLVHQTQKCNVPTKNKFDTLSAESDSEDDNTLTNVGRRKRFKTHNVAKPRDGPSNKKMTKPPPITITDRRPLNLSEVMNNIKIDDYLLQ